MLKNNGFHNRHSPFSRPFSPASFFANGEQGWWYDPSNFATLFQDSAGTTPVTAVEQPVGLQLDLSGRGNHRFQSTSANRPVVSARVNLLTKTEDFSDAVWTKSGATVTANAITAPNGTLTADKLVETSALAQHATFTSATLAATTYTSIVYAKKDEGPQRWLNLFPQGTGVSASAIFDVTNGIVTATSGAQYIDSDITPVGNDWYLCSITFTGAAVSVTNVVYLSNSGTTPAPGYTGNGTSGIYIWGADLRPTNQGVGLPVYQRVNTSTDYDSTGFPIYIKPNGSNQFMQTNSINFSSTDKMTVWQGVRKLSDAAVGMFYETSQAYSSFTGSFALYNISTNYKTASGGSLFAEATSTSLPSPITNVLTEIASISGDQLDLRINGVLNAQSTANQGTGNFGNYPAYFYARAGTTFFFNGNDYGSIARGAASTAAQITAGETYINSKTKAF